MPSLLEMTDVPMKNILEKCSYKSVLTLRKVCHSLRNFIDDSSFETDLKNIDITVFSTGFSVFCQNPNAPRKNGTGFASDWTSNDLKIILKMVQKTKLSKFSLNTTPDNSEGLDDLEEILKNLASPLQTECFEMWGLEIMKVLPHLDSKTLKQISFKPADWKTEDQSLDGIEQFLESEHFKNAVKLTIDPWFLVRAGLKKFFHFQKISVRLHETSLEEIVALKEAFVTSTHMKFFDLIARGVDKNQLEKVFGTAFHDPRSMLGGSQWFFEIQNFKEYVLRIESRLGGGLRFWKMKMKDIPENAFVQR